MRELANTLLKALLYNRGAPISAEGISLLKLETTVKKFAKGEDLR